MNVSLLALHELAVNARTACELALAAVYTADAATDANKQFSVAFDAEEATKAALVAALCAAEWGPQPDGSFVTRRSAIASVRYTCMLHAPGRQGSLAVVEDWERGSGATLVALRTRAEALALRKEERAYARTAAAAYRPRFSGAGEAARGVRAARRRPSSKSSATRGAASYTEPGALAEQAGVRGLVSALVDEDHDLGREQEVGGEQRRGAGRRR